MRVYAAVTINRDVVGKTEPCNEKDIQPGAVISSARKFVFLGIQITKSGQTIVVL